MAERIPVAVLGATGSVGQRFVQLLARHPWFRPAELVASEQRLAKEGHAVLSNTRTHRMEPDVPLLIPEVNAEHVAAIAVQRRNRAWSGFIATNPNCSTIHMVLALKPLQQAFGLEAVLVTTMQAVF